MILKTIVCIALCLSCTSCSVYKASSNDGVNVYDIKNSTTRSALLCKGMQCIESKEVDGKVVEVYRAIARKSGANYGRAIGHGVLDVCTLGLWEAVGTPIESAMDNNRGYVLAKVIRKDKNTEDLDELIVIQDGKVYFHKKFNDKNSQ